MCPRSVRPRLTLARLFDVADVPGLTDVLAGRTPLDNAVQRAARTPRLRVVTPGRHGQRRRAAAGRRASGSAIHALRRQARYLVVEAPSAASGADAQSLAGMADAAILVVAAGDDPPRPGRRRRRPAQAGRHPAARRGDRAPAVHRGHRPAPRPWYRRPGPDAAYRSDPPSELWLNDPRAAMNAPDHARSGRSSRSLVHAGPVPLGPVARPGQVALAVRPVGPGRRSRAAMRR